MDYRSQIRYSPERIRGAVVKMISCTRLRVAESQRQPQRALPQQERLEAQAEPELERRQVGRPLPVRCCSKLLLFLQTPPI